MKSILNHCSVCTIAFFIFLTTNVFAQSSSNYGKTVEFNLRDFNANAVKSTKINGLISQLSVIFPNPEGVKTEFLFDETLLSEQKINNIQTFNGISVDGKIKLKLTIVGNSMEGIMHSENGYFFIEPIDTKANLFRIYNQSETPKNASKLNCDAVHEDFAELKKNGRLSSVAPFPVGTQLRKYKLAAAATGEMTNLYGSQANALAKIVSIVNVTNLIYELEASMSFELALQTTNLSIIFSNPATDPFGLINTTNCQNAFKSMNTSGVLPFSAYGIGHTFNTTAALLGGFSSNGVAGPIPCVDTLKARAFTQWSFDAPVGLIVGVFAHEVGHQFSAWHTYNAVGGGSDSPTFCVNGWDETSAIEPGSGSTLMSYGNNCVNPVNYTLSGSNRLQYFNTKSLESIYTAINGSSGTCAILVSTSNTPPVANAGADVTIPKGTPFKLDGSATDANGDALTYTWEQYDVATANDKGALGSSINGVGGYSAVNSTTAPLFRSEQSSSSASRIFPKMAYVLANANNPADNEGEDLPQVARTMNFRFTVRDNKNGGGGVDSDHRVVTVANSGPLQLTSPNTAVSYAAGSSQTITWSVNGTNAQAANVDLLLSIDGGNSFPYLLANDTPNDGSQAVTIPSNAVNSTTARIKVASSTVGYEFFDVSNVNFTITSSCLAAASFICTETAVSALAGNSALNLGMSRVLATKVVGNSKVFSTTGIGTYPVINYTNNSYSTCQTSAWGSEKAILVPFQVSVSGNYNISLTNQGIAAFSIFTSNTVFNCNSTFVGGNSYGAIGWSSFRTITLNTCTTYYALLYDLNSTNSSIALNLNGPGDFLEIQNMPLGTSYTYTAVNQTTNLITDVSATSNFTGTAAGTYKIYGLMYANGFNTTTLIGNTMDQAYNLGSCILFSNNAKPVTILPNPCATTLTLVNPADNISSGNVTKTAASGVGGKITATNLVTGTGTRATYNARAIELNQGFLADQGTVFKAEVGGCN